MARLQEQNLGTEVSETTVPKQAGKQALRTRWLAGSSSGCDCSGNGVLAGQVIGGKKVSRVWFSMKRREEFTYTGAGDSATQEAGYLESIGVLEA